MPRLQTGPDIEQGQALIVRYETKRGRASFESTVSEMNVDRVRVDRPVDIGDLYPGKQLDVMVLIGDEPYRFISDVVAIDEALTISRPAELRPVEKRQHYRLQHGISPGFAAVTDVIGVDRNRIRLTVLDISAGGLQFVSRERLTAGDQVHMWLPIDDYRVDCIVQIVNARPPSAGRSNHRYNSRFHYIGRDDRERLARWVFSKQLDLRRRR